MTEKDQRASDYVLGTQTDAERDATRRAAAADPALAREIQTLETQMSALLLDAPEVEPPPHLFERIKAAIAAETGQVGVPGSITVRASEGRWESVCAGIERKLLWHDRVKKRVTFLIRAQAGAEFPAHQHDEDEEAYVLSGDLSFDDLILNAGDYHLARPGVRHPVGRTRMGCTLLVTTAA